MTGGSDTASGARAKQQRVHFFCGSNAWRVLAGVHVRPITWAGSDSG